MPQEPRRRHTPFGDHPNTYLVTWIFYALVLFWPLLLPGIAKVVVEVIWLAAIAVILLLAAAGRRARREQEQAEQRKDEESPISKV